MKHAFTMIELVFVIVIIGILASIAIPRLSASRDDAEIVVAARNISTIISDITGFYNSQGRLNANIGAMTSVPNPIRVGNNPCFTVTAVANTAVTVAIGTNRRCADVWSLPAMASLRTYLEGNENGKAANTFVVGGITISR